MTASNDFGLLKSLTTALLLSSTVIACGGSAGSDPAGNPEITPENVVDSGGQPVTTPPATDPESTDQTPTDPSGGDSSQPSTEPNVAFGSLSEADAVPITGAVLRLMYSVDSLGQEGSSLLLRSAVTPGAIDSSLGGLVRGSLALLFDRNNLHRAAQISNVPCVTGGSRSVELDDLNGNNAPDAGETVSVTFAQCQEYAISYVGAIAFRIVTLSGSPYAESGQWDVEIDIDFENFVTHIGEGQSISDGTISVTWRQITAGGETLTITSPEFSYTETGFTSPKTLQQTLYDIEYSSNIDPATGELAQTMDAVIEFVAFGAVNVSTTQPFASASKYEAPSLGTLKIDDKSAAVEAAFTALESISVGFDADGDGTAESQTETSTSSADEAALMWLSDHAPTLPGS